MHFLLVIIERLCPQMLLDKHIEMLWISSLFTFLKSKDIRRMNFVSKGHEEHY